MSKALKQKQEYGIPLSRYTVFLQNCPLGHDPKATDFTFYLDVSKKNNSEHEKEEVHNELCDGCEKLFDARTLGEDHNAGNDSEHQSRHREKERKYRKGFFVIDVRVCAYARRRILGKAYADTDIRKRDSAKRKEYGKHACYVGNKAENNGCNAFLGCRSFGRRCHGCRGRCFLKLCTAYAAKVHIILEGCVTVVASFHNIPLLPKI